MWVCCRVKWTELSAPKPRRPRDARFTIAMATHMIASARADTCGLETCRPSGSMALRRAHLALGRLWTVYLQSIARSNAIACF